MTTATASPIERKIAQPISKTSTSATGTRMLASCAATLVGATPASRATSASQACQSGNA